MGWGWGWVITWNELGMMSLVANYCRLPVRTQSLNQPKSPHSPRISSPSSCDGKNTHACLIHILKGMLSTTSAITQPCSPEFHCTYMCALGEYSAFFAAVSFPFIGGSGSPRMASPSVSNFERFSQGRRWVITTLFFKTVLEQFGFVF